MAAERRIPAASLLAAVTLSGLFSSPCPAVSPYDLPGEALRGRLTDDAAAVAVYRRGLSSLIAFLDANPDVLGPGDDSTRLVSRARKEELWNIWKSVLDYNLALESIRLYHAGYEEIEDVDLHHRSFRVLHAAFLAQYRYALEFTERMDRHPLDDRILNDPVPEIGLPGGAYETFKFRYLNVLRAGEFAALAAIAAAADPPEDGLGPGIAEDTAAIWRMGRGTGETLTAKNAMQVIRNAAFRAYFPIQAGVSQFMGDVRVRREGVYLVTADQVRGLLPDLLPGDVILTRREWFLSNVGLPGFWKHAALYVGTPEERRTFLSSPEAMEWVRGQGEASGEMEKLLSSRYPDAYARFISPGESGHPHRVIEAVGDGVIPTTAEHALGADSVVVLRPRLSGPEKARAIVKSFNYLGRPYDFNFDFTTDSTLVCSELVYKAYEPAGGMTGLRLPLASIAGRPVTPPNDIVRLFDQELENGAGQFSLVAFLDGFEKAGVAVPGTREELRKSWKRPNWHILVQ